MTIRVPKWLLVVLAAGAVVGVGLAVILLVVGENDEQGCVSKDTGDPISCDQSVIAVPADEYDPDASPEDQETLAESGDAAEDEDANEADELPSPQELTDAFGEIAGVCLVTSNLGTPLNFKDRSMIRENLAILTEAAAADPETPTADAGFTVRDALFDLVGQMKGCDRSLEAELQHAIDSLP